MSVFIVAHLKFTNRERYDRYQAKFAGVFGQFRGRLVAADEAPRLLEGRDGPDKLVILEFPDEAAVEEFYDAPEYRRIAIDRKAGADALILQVRGLR